MISRNMGGKCFFAFGHYIMKYYKYSMRNILGNLSRTITIMIFIFISCSLLNMFNAFIQTIVDNLKQSIQSTLSGVMLICNKDDDGDLFSMSGYWETEGKITELQMDKIAAELSDQYSYRKRIRMNATLAKGNLSVTTMVFGVENPKTYKNKFFIIKDGQWLNNDDEIVISSLQAKSLNAKIGDTITVSYYGANGSISTRDVTIVGFGEVEMLLSMNVNYVDYSVTKGLISDAGYKDVVASEIVFSRIDPKVVLGTLESKINAKLDNKDQITLHQWEDMGSFLTGAITLYSVILYIFLVLLTIVICILIINVILTSGLERRQEVGTLRAIGYTKRQVIRMYLAEYMTINVLATILGMVVSFIMIRRFGEIGINFSSPINYITGSCLYLKYDFGGSLEVSALMFLLIFLTCYFPIKKSAKMKPVDALTEN